MNADMTKSQFPYRARPLDYYISTGGRRPAQLTAKHVRYIDIDFSP